MSGAPVNKSPPQMALYLGSGGHDDEETVRQLGKLLNECAVCGIRLLGLGDSRWLPRLSELVWANSALFVWLGATGAEVDEADGIVTIAASNGITQLLDLALGSAKAVIVCGKIETPYQRLTELPSVMLPLPQTAHAERVILPVLRALGETLPTLFGVADAADALRAGYEFLWKGYPSSDDDARTTWDALIMFRCAVLADLTNSPHSARESEALTRLHEAAGSYHYYQRSDHAEALRYFARSVTASEADSSTGRFARALAAETIGLLSFDLGDFATAECAARQARERYLLARADSAPDVWFYFDHTVEGLTGDAEVYRAHRLAEAGDVEEALAALAKARTSYGKALAIQPRWQSNRTADTFGSAMGVLENLETRLRSDIGR